MNTPVSFPIAKLLKEKGFDEPCPNLYYEPERCKKPTIAEVVMWLYEKHGIWIQVYYLGIIKNGKLIGFCYELKYCKEVPNIIRNETEFNSPIEAYEAAIEYTLNNLI